MEQKGQDGNYVIELYDLLGREKMRKEIGQGINSLDISGFENGIYLFTISSSNNEIIEKGKIIKTE